MNGFSFKKIAEYFDLFCINLAVQFRSFSDYLRVVCHYYSNPKFFRTDSYLTLSYLFTNPFKISKQFLKKRGELDVHKYGETPITSFEQIVETCNITSEDTVFELGCGRGRICFWLQAFIGCQTVGIEFIPEFVTRANTIKNKFELKKIDFRNEDILRTDYKGATVLYLYGTCYDEAFINRLIERFKELPSGTKLITVSYPIADYCDMFEVMKRFPVRFTWGCGDVYLQIKR